MKNASARQVDKFRDLARIVVKHHFGSRAARVKERGGGLSNFVFEVKHPEGNFIIRISPDRGRLNAFVKEQWCERAARDEGIPTAEILETGDQIIPFPYAVARSVKGSEAVDHPERDKILRELGRLAAKINSIRTRGFGETFDWSNNELSRNKSFRDYLDGEYKYEERLAALERSRLCPTQTIKSLKRVCRDLIMLRGKPSLNHGDLRLKNVIANDVGKVVAVIDWEKATSNIAPHWELSLALHDLGVDRSEQFVTGYGVTPKQLADIAPFIKAFNLLNYTDEINRVIEAKDKQALTRLRIRLAGTFDLYSV